MAEKIVTKRPPKSPGLAGFLAIFPGIGAFYNEQFIKGIVFIFVFGGLVTFQRHGSLQPFPAFLLTGFIAYMIIDAVQSARSINQRAEANGGVKVKTEQFPTELKSGSVFWGGVLMAIGIILLMANFDIISYYTIFDLWPLAVIVVGIKFIADYFSKEKKES
ncbi:MAG: hypothetical protein JXB26_01225 [Candidatus Aminicenantes bacterium]|nr:hypothetical protein [Candidatus Aminicenantes bacterium]